MFGGESPADPGQVQHAGIVKRDRRWHGGLLGEASKSTGSHYGEDATGFLHAVQRVNGSPRDLVSRRAVARINRVAHTPAWARTALGLWIPDNDPRVAADQAKALLETATSAEPAHAEVLWRAPGHDRPAWWRAAFTATGHGAGVAWLRGEFADPTTRMIDLADVVAVLPLPPHAPSSCLHAGQDDFVSSPLRPVPDPDAPAPRVTMTSAQALVLTQYWLHWMATRSRSPPT